MPSLIVHQSIVYTADDGEQTVLGSLRDPLVLSQLVEGEVSRRQVAVADTATSVLWAKADGPADFDLVAVRASQEGVLLQLTTDDGGGGEENYTVTLRKGLWFILGSDVSYRSYTADFAGGTLDAVEKLMVENLSGAAALVDLFLVT